MAYDEQIGNPRVRGRCPCCGTDSLFLGSGGYVTCAVTGCRAPGAATDLLRDPKRMLNGIRDALEVLGVSL